MNSEFTFSSNALQEDNCMQGRTGVFTTRASLFYGRFLQAYLPLIDTHNYEGCFSGKAAKACASRHTVQVSMPSGFFS